VIPEENSKTATGRIRVLLLFTGFIIHYCMFIKTVSPFIGIKQVYP
jgi:hypothetical protein